MLESYLTLPPMDSATGVVGLVVIILVYFLPSIVAGSRHTINTGAVIVINLLLGWSLIGWVIALAMAAGGVTRDQLGIGPGVAAPQFSADGQWWWNGREWVPNRQSLPPGP